jgi:hypothetical protein
MTIIHVPDIDLNTLAMVPGSDLKCAITLVVDLNVAELTAAGEIPELWPDPAHRPDTAAQDFVAVRVLDRAVVQLGRIGGVICITPISAVVLQDILASRPGRNS